MRKGILHQEEAVRLVREQYGEEFLYETESGGEGIIPEVRSAIKKIGGNKYIWDGSRGEWGKREEGDPQEAWAID